MPAIHMQGEEGNNRAGNNAIEVKSINPRTGLLKADISQSKIGVTTCRTHTHKRVNRIIKITGI